LCVEFTVFVQEYGKSRIEATEQNVFVYFYYRRGQRIALVAVVDEAEELWLRELLLAEERTQSSEETLMELLLSRKFRHTNGFRSLLE
jgi:hypothetical protein